MATFLRRRFKQMLEKDETPISLTIQRPEGNVTLTKQEVHRYTLLLAMIDTDSDDQVGGAEGAMFLRRSGLSNDALREVWRLASGGTSKLKLSKEDWFVACKLVAAAQAGTGEPSMASLLANKSLSLADFHYDAVPNVGEVSAPEAAAAAEVPGPSIKVTVGNPTTYGSGLDRHTRYEVHTSTSLTLFTRNDMSVWRRFSDFEWLHKRLSVTFPSAIIPLFPGKRLVGNADEAFIKERMASLEAYVDKVAHHPRLNQSLDLLVFLDATDAGLEAAKRYIEAIESEDSESIMTKGVDLVMSIAAGSGNAAPLVIKADEAFVAACAGHGAALARLTSVVKTGTTLDAAQKAACESFIELGRAMVTFAAHERGNVTATRSAAAAVEAAAAAAKRAETVLFAGSASSSAPAAATGDSAAAAAFNAHSAAAANNKDGSISGMFSGDFNDPYSALNAAAPPTVATTDAAAPPAAAAADTPELFTVTGNSLVALGNLWAEQLARLEETLYASLRVERDREAELGEAIKRRDAAIDKLQDANGTLQRKKKALAALKPSEKDYAIKSAQASQAVEKAEAALTSRREELDKMTEQLKLEMARVMRTRRRNTAEKLAEYAAQQAAGARARAEAWQKLLPAVCTEAALLDTSRETVATIARKAEEKARAASAARAKAATSPPAAASGGAGGAAATTGGAGDGGAAASASGGAMFSGSSGAFGDDSHIPTASEL